MICGELFRLGIYVCASALRPHDDSILNFVAQQVALGNIQQSDLCPFEMFQQNKFVTFSRRLNGCLAGNSNSYLLTVAS